MKLQDFGPLALFLVPSVVIGYGYVIPGSCIAGWNQYTLGYASTLVGAAMTYVLGLKLVLARK